MWTEEARRAAAEARKASNKAYSNDSDVLHDKARAANEKAADLAPAKEKNTFQDAADGHSSVASGLRTAKAQGSSLIHATAAAKNNPAAGSEHGPGYIRERNIGRELGGAARRAGN